jgi:hypothetical protein
MRVSGNARRCIYKEYEQVDTDKPLDNTTNNLQSYAWPGGYPIVYLTADMAICCPKCANKKNDWEDDEVNEYFIHYEGPPEICEFCNAEIESAYGDPDDEKDEEESNE